jgi:hypothetical protein
LSANVNTRIEGGRSRQHFVDRARRRSARSTFFPHRQHFVDRSTGAAIGSTTFPRALALNAAVQPRSETAVFAANRRAEPR